ncbi:MAG: Secreted protein, partial [uncultured bacterium]
MKINFKFNKKILYFLIPLAAIILLLGGFGIYGYFTSKSFVPNIQALQEAGTKLSTAFQSQDLIAAKLQAENLSKLMGELDTKYQKVGWTSFIPFLGAYQKDGQHGINAGKYLIKSVETLIASVEPYADLLGFKTDIATPSGQPKAQSIEDRIVFMAQTLDKISPDLEKVEADMAAAQKELDQIDPARYPESISGKNIRSKIVEVKTTVAESSQLLSQAKPLIKLLPDLLGNPNSKTYMVLFQNDAELRPTGGFMTAYAFLRVTKGKIEPLSSFDIYDLDARFNKKVPAPEAVKKYLNETYLNLRNSNMSPDYKVSMDLFYKYYRDIPGFPKPDGIIAIDTRFPVEILKVIGPIGVGGWGNFSSENDPACDCPQ